MVHIGRVVFAASFEQFATLIDQIMVTGAWIAARAKFAPVEITGAVLMAEAIALFRYRGGEPGRPDRMKLLFC